jgi:hypothetical protein
VADVVGARRLRVAGPHADLGGFVVSLTARGVPLMPNGVALTGAVPARGVLRLAGAPTWDPTLRLGADPAARGRTILAALGAEPADDGLARGVAESDPERAAAAARSLIGRGPGLTPEGDDRVAATAAVLAARGWDAGWLPADLRARTTALSATLLELAAQGQVLEPVGGLFGPHWRAALARLLRVGHSTGPAYAAAAATAAALS